MTIVQTNQIPLLAPKNPVENDPSEYELLAEEEHLLLEMKALWTESDELWERCRNQLEFGSFVSADYLAIYRELIQLQGQIDTVLEWGSGLGVVTIMASRLGFDAYGIEVEPVLVERSLELAEKYGPDAKFATGSFIPDEYEWNSEITSDSTRTDHDSRAAYDELDMDLRDFDLVYAYPWPDEHPFFMNILQTCGGVGSLFLSYDAREGALLTRVEPIEA